MGKSNIDPIIQDKLQNFKSELDKEALWNSINGSIPGPVVVAAPAVNTNSTTQVVKATSLALLISLTVGMAYYLMSPQPTQSSHSVETAAQKIIPSPKSIPAKSLISTIEKRENVIVPITETTSPITTQAKTKIVTNQNTISSKEAPLDKTFTLNNETPNQSQKSVSSVGLLPSSQSTDVKVTSRQKSILGTTQQVAQPTTLSAFTTSSKTLAQLFALNKSTVLPLNLDNEKVAISLSHLAPIKDKVNCYDYSSKKPKLSIIGYYGPGMSIRSLTTTDTEMTNYKSAREDSEVMLENHRAGLQLKASHKSGIYGKVGIEASVINEKFSQYTETRRQEVQYGLLETITQPDGSIDEIYGDQIVTIISKKEWRNHNKFETIDFTLFLGYEMAINRLRYHLEAGVIYNLGTRFEGTFLDATTLQPQEVSSDYYKSQTGVDLHVAAGIGYDLSDNLTLTLSPSLRYDLKVVNESTYPLDQKYIMVSLLAGAEYRF